MGSLMDIRRQMMSVSRKLPLTYQRCDYLQSTGNKARIDTGIAGNDTTLQIAGELKAMDFGAYNAFLGNHDGDSKRCWRIIQPGAQTSKNIIFGTYKSISVSPAAVSQTWASLPVRFTFAMQYGHVDVTVNGTTISANATDTGLPENSKTIGIGARNPTATVSASGTVRHRFYWVKIWRQNKLVRDYIPCVRKSDSKAGFYDLVNRTFNPSSGIEDFVAGND